MFRFLFMFFGMKGLLVTIVTVTFPIIFKNLFVWIIDIVYQIVEHVLPSEMPVSNITLELTGLAAYLANQLMIPECLAILITAMTIRSVLMFIPFVR